MLDYFHLYLLPLAIRIGMTPDQFWEDDPELFWNYWDAFEMRKKEEAREANVIAFNQGQYMVLAIAQCLQFTKHPKQIYPKKPFGFDSDKKVQMTQEEYEKLRKVQMQNLAKKFENK